MRLENKVAIVTGAGRGLGRGIALKLATEGAKVVVADMAPADETVALIEKSGGIASAFTVNVSRQEEVQAMVKYAIDTYGTLDIMVNNAGINRDGMLHKMPVENWQLVIDVDLTGAFFGTQEAIKYMRQKGYGRVINISSGSWLGNIGQANYAAAKAGVVGLTKTAARENARKGITCNAICPGFIEKDMTLKLKEVNDGAAWESMMQRIPMGYAGKAADVGNMVAFLASDEASYITSEVINVGGGINSTIPDLSFFHVSLKPRSPHIFSFYHNCISPHSYLFTQSYLHLH